MHRDDAEQQKIIELADTTALVLAGPGCGKTHILARRVSFAANRCDGGMDRMLCVTFTNRAAREMTQRIERYLGRLPQGLFVGNMHRFCLRFLFENNILGADTTVLDEEDQFEYLSTILATTSPRRIKDFLSKAAYLYQRNNDHPDWIVRRPESPFTDQDYEALDQYAEFKQNNRLIDFDDILLMAYSALMQQPLADYSMVGYNWVQVDEVQDMTPLQLAIVDAVTVRHRRTLVYFGDEQQAIFRFIGAGGRALEVLKQQCRGNILRLTRNYRSPGYLVGMCNTLARDWLSIDPAFLPEAVDTCSDAGNLSLYSVGLADLPLVTAGICRRWISMFPDDNTAVLTRTNKEADMLSGLFTSLGIDHFHVSKQDLFCQVPFKTVWCHLAALVRPSLRHPWARLLYQMHCVSTLSGARNLVRILRNSAVGCDELLRFDKPFDVERLVDIFDSGREIVVFDTETTGLDVHSDEIVQIAAVKLCRGVVLDRFEVFIHTSRHLPRELAGGIPNPIVLEYDAADKKSPEEAFAAFISFVGDAVPAGHNVTFDIAILRSNISRRTSLNIPPFLAVEAESFDTLALARQLFPKINNHRLSDLITALGIEGVNSHNAADDAAATASLLTVLADKAADILPRAIKIHRDDKIRRVADKFTAAYGSFYTRCQTVLSRPVSQGNTLTDAIRLADDFMSVNGYTSGISHLGYVSALFDRNIVGYDSHATLSDVLGKYLFDILAFNESDLFAADIIDERLSVMTIHKAKGLEMDNVIIFDISTGFGDVSDYARVLYVAFSRAKKRLAVGVGGNMPRPMVGLLPFFRRLTPAEVRNVSDYAATGVK